MTHPSHGRPHRNGAGPPSRVAGARPVLLVRHRPGTAGETARVVHLVPLPGPGEPPGALTALCGLTLPPTQVEQVTPGHGAPCTACLLAHALLTSLLTDPHATPPAPAPGATPGSTRTAALLSAAGTYRAWGWPITLHRDQIHLTLAPDLTALALPAPLAARVAAILTARRCPPAVLVHPAAPDHPVLLAGQPAGMTLPWPPDAQPLTGALLLPPTPTPQGPLTWTRAPGPDTLRLVREIDLFAALRTALTTPPPETPPGRTP